MIEYTQLGFVDVFPACGVTVLACGMGLCRH